MELSVLDIVTVTKQACCYGHKRNTRCQIIQEAVENGVKVYLCYPTDCGPGSGPQVAFWGCARCLEKVENNS